MVNGKELHNDFETLLNQKEYFNTFYDKYKNLIYSIAFSILKNRENSEEIVQAVFLKIWIMKKETLPTKNESSWIYTITKNETIDFLRKQKKYISLDELYNVGQEDTNINAIIEQDGFNKIISKLDILEQEIISLKILANLTFREISHILKIPIGTVQWKYYKSMYNLKILLTNLCIIFTGTCAIILGRIIKKRNSQTTNTEIIENNSTILDIPNNGFGLSEKTNNMQNTILVEETDNVEFVSDVFPILSISLLIIILFTFFFIKFQQKIKYNSSK